MSRDPDATVDGDPSPFSDATFADRPADSLDATIAGPPRPAADDGDATRAGTQGGGDPSDVTRYQGPPPDDGGDATRFHEPPAAGDDATLAPGARVRPPADASADAGPLAIGEQFGPRYRIIRLLGIGGMGAVYQAWDSELDVVVALKVIRPEATADPREARAIERRFKQELLLARQVTHKNVVRIHDLGEIDGIKYITMSFVDGDDLATILKQSGKLPVPEALRIMRQVASGLQAAHEAGVVHRDLKPPNIMVEGDRAIIMDFGIARSAHVAPAATAAGGGTPGGRPRQDAHQTMAGTIVGTIAYMAPEQARGEAADQRADIYALGLIMSDLLLGRRPAGSQRSAVEELQQRMTQAPPPVRTADPQIPEAIERIVSRCVAPDPGQRFQTTAELVAALDRLDDAGKPLPLVRRLTPRMMAAAALVMIALLAGTYFATRQALTPVVQPDPVSVVIADIANATGDAAFDRTLEPMLRRALEGAGFISAFDRTRLSGATGERPPDVLDETAAREIAVKQGLGVVLAGAIAPQGGGYGLSLKAVQSVTGNVVTTVDGRAASREDVLPALTRLVASVRTALGDVTSESDQMFAMTTLSATSLDVVRHYAAGMEASSNNRFEEARASFAKAVELDPKFGIGYSSLAAASRNLGRVQEAEQQIQQALQYLDGMTERERFSARGFYYRMTGDYQQCVQEYGELVSRYEADIVGRNQRALCLSKLRDMKGAVDEMQHVVEMLPNRAVFRDNLALYANYAGDFATAEREARRVGETDAYALLALAFAQLGQGQTAAARATYEKLGALSPLGASMATLGLADLATVAGRYEEAAGLLTAGAEADAAAKNADRAATKWASLAYVEGLRQRPRAAVQAADRALDASQSAKIQFLAARAYIDAGQAARAKPLIARLGGELQAEPQAYARILEGEAALAAGDARQAIKILAEANGLLDTWIGHFALGRAYLEAGAFIQADGEFDRCLKRRGEALSLFVDEHPTFGHFPAAYYYQGRVRQAMKNAGFAESYRTYLTFRGESTEDPRVAEVRPLAGS